MKTLSNITFKDFTQKELDFWQSKGQISEKTLNKLGVKSIASFEISENQNTVFRAKDLNFVFAYPTNSEKSYKLYMPIESERPAYYKAKTGYLPNLEACREIDANYEYTFGLNELKGNKAVICEGEADCLALIEKGYNAFTLGAVKGFLSESITNQLRAKGINHISILFDTDFAGVTHSEKLKKELGFFDCEIIEIPRLKRQITDKDEKPTHNDICDYIGLYGFDEDLQHTILRSLVGAKKVVSPDLSKIQMEICKTIDAYPYLLEQNLDKISPHYFSYKPAKMCIEVMIALWKDLEQIDLLTIRKKAVEMFGEAGKDTRDEMVKGLMTSTVSWSENERKFPSYLEYIKDMHLASELRKIGQKIYTNDIEEINPYDEARKAKQSIENLLADTSTSESVTIHESGNKLIEMLDSVGEPSISTGIKSLDRVIGGIYPSLITLAGRSSMGKTSFGLHLVNQVANAGKFCYVFSLEMSPLQVTARIASMRLKQQGHNIAYTDVLKKKLTRTERQLFEQEVRNLSTLPIQVDTSYNANVDSIVSTTHLLAAKQELGMIMIDHVGFVKGTRQHKTENDRVSEVMRELKLLSEKLQLPILLLSQLNREVEKRPNRKPQLSDLRDSGSLEQDSDIVMFTFRPEYYGITQDEQGQSTKGLFQIGVDKQRDGAVAPMNASPINLTCDLPTCYFYEPENDFFSKEQNEIKAPF